MVGRNLRHGFAGTSYNAGPVIIVYSMGIRFRGTVLESFIAAALLIAGCNSAQRASTQNEGSSAEPPGQASAARRMAEAALGKHAEILVAGDLAKNGLEQILAINRSSNLTEDSAGTVEQSGIPITRAAILQNSNGKLSEVLRCDEYLKNPNGYLVGSPATRVTGWRLQYVPDKRQGLELRFMPAGVDSSARVNGGNGAVGQIVVVRWNASAKRYQSLDPSQERYLNEVPTLETPHSVLK